MSSLSRQLGCRGRRTKFRPRHPRAWKNSLQSAHVHRHPSVSPANQGSPRRWDRVGAPWAPNPCGCPLRGEPRGRDDGTHPRRCVLLAGSAHASHAPFEGGDGGGGRTSPSTHRLERWAHQALADRPVRPSPAGVRAWFVAKGTLLGSHHAVLRPGGGRGVVGYGPYGQRLRAGRPEGDDRGSRSESSGARSAGGTSSARGRLADHARGSGWRMDRGDPARQRVRCS